MYTKEVEDDDEVFYMDPDLALPLYAFAQFFELNDRDLVLQWFKENIGFDNVVFIANYCHLRHFYFSEIYDLCLKFIANNHANISKIEMLPDIHDEILKAALCSVKPRKSAP
uniref:Uncharacterized protein n=1 Tax=Panagrolaimus sp. JU765 TaxID=591449 RepID=A0AC34RH13_9BILA